MWSGLLWCCYQLFGLSFWRHPFTAEHPLVMQCCISPNLMILDDLRMRTYSWNHEISHADVSSSLSRLVEPKDGETAGALMTFFLALGLSLGAALSFPLRFLVWRSLSLSRILGSQGICSRAAIINRYIAIRRLNRDSLWNRFWAQFLTADAAQC